MIYQLRMFNVEAEPVLLAQSKLVVAAIDGVAHIIPADIFALFFKASELPIVLEPAPVETTSEQSVPRPARKPKPSPRPKTKAVASPEKSLSTGKAVLIAVKEGTHTQTTAIDRACVILGWNPADKTLRERVYQCIWLKLKNGELVKRDDPNTQLPILHLAGIGK